MKRFSLLFALLFGAVLSANTARAQAHPTATRTFDLSAFSGVAGVNTGLPGVRNLSIVAGAALGLMPIHGVRPALEVRGLYPMVSGNTASQRTILFGPRAEFMLNRRLHPYGDVLAGRGQMDFMGPNGVIFNGFSYYKSTTWVYSPGVGVDYDLSRHLSFKVDAQFQLWRGWMPTPSGNLWNQVGTVGVVYHFGLGGRIR